MSTPRARFASRVKEEDKNQNKQASKQANFATTPESDFEDRRKFEQKNTSDIFMDDAFDVSVQLLSARCSEQLRLDGIVTLSVLRIAVSSLTLLLRSVPSLVLGRSQVLQVSVFNITLWALSKVGCPPFSYSRRFLGL